MLVKQSKSPDGPGDTTHVSSKKFVRARHQCQHDDPQRRTCLVGEARGLVPADQSRGAPAKRVSQERAKSGRRACGAVAEDGSWRHPRLVGPAGAIRTGSGGDKEFPNPCCPGSTNAQCEPRESNSGLQEKERGRLSCEDANNESHKSIAIDATVLIHLSWKCVSLPSPEASTHPCRQTD